MKLADLATGLRLHIDRMVICRLCWGMWFVASQTTTLVVGGDINQLMSGTTLWIMGQFEQYMFGVITWVRILKNACPFAVP